MPIRLAFGAFFLHVALTHRELDERGAKGLQRFASSGYPFLKKVPPRTFQQGMVTAEFAVAASLLVPGVPAVVGGAALDFVRYRAVGRVRPHTDAAARREERATERPGAVDREGLVDGGRWSRGARRRVLPETTPD